MATHAIISYDDTQDDHDALQMGRVLAEAGASLTLAYVRHIDAAPSRHEQLGRQRGRGAARARRALARAARPWSAASS